MNSLKHNAKHGKKTTNAGVTAFAVMVFAYAITLIDVNNPLSILLIENKELIISLVSTVSLGLITLFKK